MQRDRWVSNTKEKLAEDAAQTEGRYRSLLPNRA